MGVRLMVIHSLCDVLNVIIYFFADELNEKVENSRIDHWGTLGTWVPEPAFHFGAQLGASFCTFPTCVYTRI